MLTFPFPEGFLSEDPGISSVLVSYGRMSDFFYSGHVGFALICAFEWKNLGFPRIYTLGLFATAYMAFVVIVLRWHYTCGNFKFFIKSDIFTAVLMGHYCTMIAEKYSPYIDSQMRALYIK
jgi:hypothetical protein